MSYRSTNPIGLGSPDWLVAVRRFHGGRLFVAASVLLALNVTLFSGCDPTRFLIQGTNPIQCRIYSRLETVSYAKPNILLSDSALIDLSAPGLTQYSFSTYVRLLKGDGFVLILRPRAEETLLDSGTAVVFSRRGSYVDSSGVRVLDLSQIRFPLDSLQIITVRSDNNLMQVTLGCDTILKRMTPMKESDDIVIGTLPGSEVRIVRPVWLQLKDEKQP